MISWAGILSDQEIWDVTYYLRTFSNADLKLPPVNLELAAIESSGDASKNITDQVVEEVRRLLEESLNTYKANKVDDESIKKWI